VRKKPARIPEDITGTKSTSVRTVDFPTVRDVGASTSTSSIVFILSIGGRPAAMTRARVGRGTLLRDRGIETLVL